MKIMETGKEPGISPSQTAHQVANLLAKKGGRGRRGGRITMAEVFEGVEGVEEVLEEEQPNGDTSTEIKFVDIQEET